MRRGVEVLLITKRNCPACDLARSVWGKYIGSGITEVDIDELSPELDRQIYDGEEGKRVPKFAVVLPDGEVLITARAIPPVEELLD